MPLYEYKCDACGHRFEVIQRFSDAPVEICPTCGGTVHKLMSSPAIQFKGSGWYITDYAKKEQSAAAKSNGGKGSSDGKEGETGSRGKTDATPSKAAASRDAESASSSSASSGADKK